jgi:hypothetical protein
LVFQDLGDETRIFLQYGKDTDDAAQDLVDSGDESEHLSGNKQLPAFVADFVGKTVRSAGTYSFMDP